MIMFGMKPDFEIIISRIKQSDTHFGSVLYMHIRVHILNQTGTKDEGYPVEIKNRERKFSIHMMIKRWVIANKYNSIITYEIDLMPRKNSISCLVDFFLFFTQHLFLQVLHFIGHPCYLWHLQSLYPR